MNIVPHVFSITRNGSGDNNFKSQNALEVSDLLFLLALTGLRRNLKSEETSFLKALWRMTLEPAMHHSQPPCGLRSKVRQVTTDPSDNICLQTS